MGPILFLFVVSMCVLIDLPARVYTAHSTKNDYCKISPTHVMCLYTVNVLGPECPKGTQISPLRHKPDEDAFINIHNTYRRNVAKGLEKGMPPASNMIELKWDDELALSAQAWANQCIYNLANLENPKLTNSVRRFQGNVGQSGIRLDFATQDTWTVRNLRHGGFKNMNESFNSLASKLYKPTNDDKEIGRAFRIAWADSKFVGCGSITGFNEKSKSEEGLIFCNFGPVNTKNNITGMYKEGKAASSCPKGSTPNDGLCRF